LKSVKRIVEVVFKFEDGAEKVLKNDELEKWIVLCLMKSDYLLPANETMVLAKIFGGIVMGFVPPEALNRKDVERW